MLWDSIMNPLPKVSVLIPTFRQEDYVSSAISSALDQNYPNLEVIVVDDASPDQTADKVNALHDPRLYYVRNEHNLGRVKNYRRALYELATGEWAVILDGDDFFIDPDFISRAIKLACSEPGIVIVSAQMKVMTPTEEIEPSYRDTTVISGKEALLRYHDQQYQFPHFGTLYHRPSALACDFYRVDILSSDWESLLRLALKGKVAYLDRVVGCWNLLGNNASHSNLWRDYVKNLTAWESIYQTATTVGIPLKDLEHARHANLLSIAYRDLCQIFKGGAVLGAFKYLYHGFPVLKAFVTLRIIVHPYIWAKCVINIYRRFLHRVAC